MFKCIQIQHPDVVWIIWNQHLHAFTSTTTLTSSTTGHGHSQPLPESSGSSASPPRFLVRNLSLESHLQDYDRSFWANDAVVPILCKLLIATEETPNQIICGHIPSVAVPAFIPNLCLWDVGDHLSDGVIEVPANTQPGPGQGKARVGLQYLIKGGLVNDSSWRVVMTFQAARSLKNRHFVLLITPRKCL